jgi:hypothetical protein
MYRGRKYLRSIAGLMLLAGISVPAYSSILDNDPDCNSNGCAVISYGTNNFIIYDNVNTDGSAVTRGQPMVPRMSSPGIVNVTGTLSAAVQPNLDEGVLLGFSEDGTTLNQSVTDVDLDGFLDAGDNFIGPVSLSATTDIILDPRARTYSHSFFITSMNTRMSLRARIHPTQYSGDLGQTISPADILLTPSVTTQGNDNGFNFGQLANVGGIEINTTVTDLDDLSGLSTTVINFNRRRGIRKRNGDLDEQSIRLDFLYTMPDYDLSMGVGSMTVRLEFELFNEDRGNNGNNGNNGNGNGANNCDDPNSTGNNGNSGNSGNTCNNGNTGNQ